MNGHACCFTGHRILPCEKLSDIQNTLSITISQYLKQGVCKFYCGGALGFDMLAAFSVLSLRRTFHHARLILALPCSDQDKYWTQEQRAAYRSLLHQANKIVYSSQRYARGCMHSRNRYMVDHSDMCICYLKKETGGTAYTVHYAVKKGLEVVNIAQSK